MKLTEEQVTQLRETAVEQAILYQGEGETTGNNQGQFITDIGGRQGMEWCALFAGHCYRNAYDICGYEQPQWLYRGEVAEPGARRLYNALSLVGWHFKDCGLVVPGDLICWTRDKGGHIAIIIDVDEDEIVITMEGNVGRYPAKVKQLSHDIRREPHFVGFATLRTKEMATGLDEVQTQELPKIA